MNSRKITLSLLLAIIFSFPVFSQGTVLINRHMAEYDENIVKLNLTGLPLRNFGFQVERLLARKTSVALGMRFMPNGKLPMLGSFESLIDDEETFQEMNKVQASNFAITPELRFYTGKHNGARGFYIAPYFRYTNFGLDFQDFEYTISMETGSGGILEETRNVDLDGRINGISGGVMFGAQWKFGRSLYLDWWIIGGSYGKSNGDISALTNLTQDEQDGLREALEDMDIPIVETSVTVNDTGAKMSFDGPWASFRGGLSLGFRF